VRKALRIVGVGLLVVIVVALGFYLWASRTAARKLARVYHVHSYDFPIPFPCTARTESGQRPPPTISAMAASAHATPATCRRLSRSPSTTRARSTVLAG